MVGVLWRWRHTLCECRYASHCISILGLWGLIDDSMIPSVIKSLGLIVVLDGFVEFNLMAARSLV